VFYTVANSIRFRDLTPEQIVAILSEECNYYGSSSTLYRILRKRKAMQHRQETKKPVKNVKAIPTLVTGPNQVWAWDNTWLKTDVVGLFKYGYTIIDLFDRTIVGWSVEDSESDQHARTLFERVIRNHKVVPKIIHADNGGPMRGVSLGAFLDSLCVTRSHSRPRCSNDNAFIESWHKTLKHTVGYPAFFSSLEHARAWYANFVAWYNHEHLHSSLGYVTPHQRRTGEALEIYRIRNQTILNAKMKHPLRWRTGKVRTYDALPISMSCRPWPKAA
jgi:transposase InsO family protein